MRRLRIIGLGLMVVCLGCSSADKPETVAGIIGEPLTSDELNVSLGAEYAIREDYIAECMGAQGFDYVAWVDPRMTPQVSAVEPEMDSLSPLEFAEQYGFGISTRPEPEPGPEPGPNPNDEIYDALSGDAQDAYGVALTGQPSLEEFQVYEVSGATRGANSCEQYAYDRLVPAGGPSEEVMQQYGDLLSEIRDRTSADQRVLDADTVGVLCLRESGFEVEADVPIIDQFLLQAESLAGMEIFSLEALQASLTDEKVEEVQDFERDFATTVHECFAEMRSVEEVVRIEVEQEVVADNYSVFVEASKGLRQNRGGD